MSLRSVRFAAEYALARTALAVLPRLSRPMAVGLAHVSGTLASIFSRHLRAVSLANLELALGDSLTPAERRRVVRRSFQSFALVLIDMFWFARDSENRIRTWVHFDPSFDAFMRSAPQVCVTAHMGNWEVLGMAFALRGFPLVSVAAPLENRRLDRLFIDLRKRTGQQILSKHGAVRGLMRALKEGGKVALVMDQNTKPSAGGVFVDFFGLPVPVSSAPAALALRTGAELRVGIMIPDRNGRYVATHHGRVDREDSDGETEAELTTRLAQVMVRLIREHPEHWLWMYKRWKYVGPNRARSEYPFYAKQLTGKDAEIATAATVANRPE